MFTAQSLFFFTGLNPTGKAIVSHVAANNRILLSKLYLIRDSETQWVQRQQRPIKRIGEGRKDAEGQESNSARKKFF